MNLQELEKIIVVKETYNLNSSEIFDYFRIAKINNDEGLIGKANVLYFPTSVSDEEVLKDGWYINSWDTRAYIDEVITNNPNFTFVVEENMLGKIDLANVKVIVVDNIMASVSKLAEYKLNNYQGKKILVTGSVGKTSMTGLLESVIKDNVLRIYSKRITPLILDTFITNYLDSDIKYLVMESGMFRKFHVDYFANRLKPDIGIILNIMAEHINVDDIKSKEDIIASKIKLLAHANIGIINDNDDTLKKLIFTEDKIYYENKEISTHHLQELIRINEYNKELKPMIKTELSYLFGTIGLNVANVLKIPEHIAIGRIDNYESVENRIHFEEICEHKIIFDGEVTSHSRIEKLSNHLYNKSCLVIWHLSVQLEEEEDYSLLTNCFNKFDKVYINKDLTELPLFINNSNVIVVPNLEFIKSLDMDIAIFFHYGSYYRNFSKFTVKDLESELR